jgi:phospholipid/cholesterol/gamma-HCH transport system ATP-binding protein
MSENSYAVKLEHVSKAFGSHVVLEDVSFEVLQGSAFCILGPSGTGKSVTLRLIIGLTKPESGKIYVEEDEITALDSRGLARVRKEMGFLFQSAALFDSITVGENVAFPLRRHTNHPDELIRQLALEKLQLVGLEREYEKMPSDLSGGMRKRAGLARALAMNPAILLVDEPSAGLDPIMSSEIDDLLLDLKQRVKATIVIVTHNIRSARRIADEIIMLHRARIIARGAVKDFEKSENPLVQAFMQSKESG